jgi:lactate dehydrogenase-like 2-hydroxyacid dehydrogenase
MTKPRVFVAQPIPEPALDILREAAEVEVYPYLDRQISVAELAAGARRAEWLYVLHETNVTAEVLEANPRLKGIAAMAKFDPCIDFAVAHRLNIPIIVEDPTDSAFGGVSITTADLTVGMLLGLAYRIGEADRYTRCGKFRQEQTMALMGLGCLGKSVGLIGMGKVAEAMVPRLKPLGLEVIYTKRTRLPDVRERELGIAWCDSLDALLGRVDYVVVACDYNGSTHKLIGRRELDLMKPSAFLINTARGRIVDEPELIAALQDRRIAGAGLDVYWDEPPHVQDPAVPEALCRLENVMLAPHNGGATVDVRVHRTSEVARFLVQMIRTGRAPHVLGAPSGTEWQTETAEAS